MSQVNSNAHAQNKSRPHEHPSKNLNHDMRRREHHAHALHGVIIRMRHSVSEFGQRMFSACA